MSAGILWERIVAISGTDDPNQLTYYTGMGYAQLTRYAAGRSGMVRGPAAADLAEMARTLAERTGRPVTMGQLWGEEPLTAFDLAGAAASIPPGAQAPDPSDSIDQDEPPPRASRGPRGAPKPPPSQESDGNGEGERSP